MTQRYKYISKQFEVPANHWYAITIREGFKKGKEFTKDEWMTQMIKDLEYKRPDLKDSGNKIKAGTTWSWQTKEGYIVEV